MSRTVAPVTVSEPQLFDIDTEEEEDDVYCGNINTFALVKSKAGGFHRGRPSHREKNDTRLVILPYFGRFAGRWVTCEIDRGRCETGQLAVVQMKVDGKLICRRHCNTKRNSIRDVCILKVHEAEPSHDEASGILPTPPSLSFLCERQVILCGSVAGLPLTLVNKLNSTTKQDIFVRIWPSELARHVSCVSSPTESVLKLRVPMRISLSELEWVVCAKLRLPNPPGVIFYKPDGIRQLFSSCPVLSDQTQLDCFVRNAAPHPRDTCVGMGAECLVLPVSVIGKGIEEVPVQSDMTLLQFETAVVGQFGLSSHSFLFFPLLLSPMHRVGLKMFCSATRKNAACLIDQYTCKFPTTVINNMDPHMSFNYKFLPFYQENICDLGLLSFGEPIVGFDVTGPTIPLSFRAMHTCSDYSDSSGTCSTDSSSASASAIFVQSSVENRIVSVNDEWTGDTLLKYIATLSGFSCRRLVVAVDNRSIPVDAKIGPYVARKWVVKGSKGQFVLSPNVLHALL